jgi:hypothetical protein
MSLKRYDKGRKKVYNVETSKEKCRQILTNVSFIGRKYNENVLDVERVNTPKDERSIFR